MGLLDSFKKLFNKEEDETSGESIETITSNNIVYEIDEEDRIVVALAASAMAGKNKPNSEFHISKITRIK